MIRFATATFLSCRRASDEDAPTIRAKFDSSTRSLSTRRKCPTPIEQDTRRQGSQYHQAQECRRDSLQFRFDRLPEHSDLTIIWSVRIAVISSGEGVSR